jgi:Amt family ammonium transporter
VWSGVVSVIAFVVANQIVGMRVRLETEQTGLDLTEHQEQAYEIV